MAACYDMEPNYLRTYELNYELRIRNVVTDRVDVSLRRKYLRRELKRDLARPETEYATPNFQFEHERTELSESIRSITDLINNYDGINVEVGNRVRSRINHVLGRLSRIPDGINADVSNYRGDNIVIVSALEEDLAETIERYKVGEAAGVSIRGDPAGFNVATNKSVAVYKWPVRFNGRSDKNSLNSFLQRVEELRLARKCTKEELFEAASDLFEDYALEWYRAQFRHQKFDSWDSLVRALRKDFLPSDYDSELWKQIEKRTQHYNEPVVIYISIMENLFECLSEKPSEEKKLRVLMSQVLPEYQNHIALQNVQEISRLVEVCRALEESERAKKAFRPPPNRNIATLEPGLACAVSTMSNQPCCSSGHASKFSNNESQRRDKKKFTRKDEDRSANTNTSRERNLNNREPNQISEIHCWKCNGVGHLKRNCNKQQRVPVCFGCGKSGVIRPNCPTCSPKNEDEEDEM